MLLCKKIEKHLNILKKYISLSLEQIHKQI